MTRWRVRVSAGSDSGTANVPRAAGADQAKLLVVGFDDTERTLRMVEAARRNHPGLTLLARTRRHARLLMDRGVDGLVRDTFHSGLRLAKMSLAAAGVGADAAARAVVLFLYHNDENLVATHAVYRDKEKLLQDMKDSAEELTLLFEADRGQG